MKSLCIVFVIFLSLVNGSRVAIGANALEFEVPLQIEPGHLYVDQEEKIQILVKPRVSVGEKLPSKLFLVRVDETGKRVRDLAVITDEGTLGDMKSGDGYYSRKMKIIERIPGTVYLSLATQAEKSEKLPILNQIQVMTRPSFIEVLKQVWKKITSSPLHAG